LPLSVLPFDQLPVPAFSCIVLKEIHFPLPRKKGNSSINPDAAPLYQMGDAVSSSTLRECVLNALETRVHAAISCVPPLLWLI